MNVFHYNLGVSHLNIVVGEIPKGSDAAVYQMIGYSLSRLTGNAEYSHINFVIAAELFQFIFTFYQIAVYLFAYYIRFFVEKGAEVKSRLGKVYIGRKGTSQIAHADKYSLEIAVKSEDFLYLITQESYIVAVSLLTESAEAVEVLSYLRGGQLHQLRQFL